jgi:hypothetical protein
MEGVVSTVRSTSSTHKMSRTNDFRVLVVLASAALILLLASGAALAANRIDCSNNPGTLCFGTPRNDEIKGTDGRDEIRAREGSDVVRAGGGNDLVYGQRGADSLGAGQCGNNRMFGNRGDDKINISDRGCAFIQIVGEPGPESVGDRADCGRGFDVVRGVNRYDRVADNCERIVRE